MIGEVVLAGDGDLSRLIKAKVEQTKKTPTDYSASEICPSDKLNVIGQETRLKRLSFEFKFKEVQKTLALDIKA